MTRCRSNADHDWVAIRGGRERCAKCRSTFPCGHACRHADCLMARGEPLPDHISSPGYVPTVLGNTPAIEPVSTTEESPSCVIEPLFPS